MRRQKYDPYFMDEKAEEQRSNLLEIAQVASSRGGIWTWAVNIILQHFPCLSFPSPKDSI